MPALDARIDELYRLPPGEFAAGKAALAKALKGPDQSRVKQLKKPTSVPWAVNQVYWHARPVFDALLREGTRLRRAQIAALEGRPGDVRRASETHRRSITAAISEAVRLAEAAGVRPSRDELAQTFEALSLEHEPSEPHGRLTRPLQPRGFEMLAGVKVSASPRPAPGGRSSTERTAGEKPPTPDRRAEEAKRRQAADVSDAEDAVAQARASLARARQAADLATEALLTAEQRLEALRSRRSG